MTAERAGEARQVGPRLLLSLITGRVVLRLLLYASGVVLVAAWSDSDFTRYAAAVGAAVWLTPLVQAGPEKAALKLVPRARRTRVELVGLLAAVAALVPIPFVAATVVAVLAGPYATVTLYVATAAHQATLGCNMLVIALHRALERPGRDIANYAVMSVALAALMALTLWTGLAPITYVCALLGLTLALNAVLLRSLPRAGSPTSARRALRKILFSTAALMGTSEVLSNIATSALYVELAVTSHADQSGNLYLISMAWSALLTTVYFLQRIFQPRRSARSAGDGRAERDRSVRLARLVLRLSVIWLVVAGAAVALAPAGDTGAWSLPALGVLMLSRVPLYLLMSYGAYVLENIDGDGLRVGARGAVLGMAAVVLTGAVTIPLFGAAGAVYALGARELVLSWRISLFYRPSMVIAG